MPLVGRFEEKAYLEYKIKTKKPELIAVTGRRRVGKTFFVKEALKGRLFLHFTGLYEGTLDEHMERFGKVLNEIKPSSMPILSPRTWFEAFDALALIIEKSRSKRKKIIFLDEVPWMAGNRSRFLTAFTDFWNSWATSRSDIMIILCGSSASWMIQKILKNKGGLHNRVIGRILMKPFTLHESELLLRQKGVAISRQSIIDLYMILGGIPYYLEQIEKGESIAQAIDRLFFSAIAPIRDEYHELFASLFRKAHHHRKVVEALNKHPRGLTRSSLITKTDMISGGGFTSILEELESSNFITSYIPYGRKKKDAIWKLTDPYTLFYLKYVDGGKRDRNWLKIYNSHSWYSWSGLAFENLCQLHSFQIKTALRISGIHSILSSWHHIGSEDMPGAQIDLLVDRADNVVNICELKYSTTPFTITKDYANKLRQKVSSFRHFTKSRKALFTTIIAPYGTTENAYYQELIQNVIVMDDLFVPTAQP